MFKNTRATNPSQKLSATGPRRTIIIPSRRLTGERWTVSHNFTDTELVVALAEARRLIPREGQSDA